jgi:aryl carrier-like protein
MMYGMAGIVPCQKMTLNLNREHSLIQQPSQTEREGFRDQRELIKQGDRTVHLAQLKRTWRASCVGNVSAQYGNIEAEADRSPKIYGHRHDATEFVGGHRKLA